MDVVMKLRSLHKGWQDHEDTQGKESTFSIAAEEIERLRGELYTTTQCLVESRKNANRYSWLRSNNYGGIAAQMLEYYQDEELDAAIDEKINS